MVCLQLEIVEAEEKGESKVVKKSRKKKVSYEFIENMVLIMLFGVKEMSWWFD